MLIPAREAVPQPRRGDAAPELAAGRQPQPARAHHRRGRQQPRPRVRSRSTSSRLPTAEPLTAPTRASPRARSCATPTPRRKRQTVRYYRKVGVRGRLINASGNPISGAEVRLLTRDLRQGSSAIDRKGIRTRSDGSFRVTVRSKASRQLQFAWRARVNDARSPPTADLTLKARASGRLRVRAARRARRPERAAHRPPQGRAARGRADRPAGQAARREALPDVRGHDLQPPRHVQGPLHVPLGGLARAGLVFRARIRRAPGFPYETGTTRSVRVRVR